MQLFSNPCAEKRSFGCLLIESSCLEKGGIFSIAAVYSSGFNTKKRKPGGRFYFVVQSAAEEWEDSAGKTGSSCFAGEGFRQVGTLPVLQPAFP